MKPRFKHYFYFSRQERIGVVGLLSICIAIFAVPSILQQFRPKPTADFSEFEAVVQAFRQSAKADTASGVCFSFDPNTAAAEDFRKLGLSEKIAQNICRYREKGGSFRKPDDFKKIWGLEEGDFKRLVPFIRIAGAEPEKERNFTPEDPEYFPFDPNTATEEEFHRLGLPERTIAGILNYRNKGGVFRRKEDFAKIYTLSEDDYKRLEPFIQIKAPAPAMYAAGGGFPKAAPASLDMNKADVAAWDALPMVGERRAQQIVNFRDKLGGFSSIDQLAEMYGLPDSVFQIIRPYLTLENTGGVRKINLNAVDLEALDRHPYISRKQATLIIAYRDQHGPYKTAEEILNIKAFTDKAWWDKVSPYLGVE